MGWDKKREKGGELWYHGKRCKARESYCINGVFAVKKVSMQISKAFLFVCPALLCVAPLTLNAADSPEQIKAREALEKLYQSQPPAVAPAAAPAPAPAVQPAPAPAPAPKPAKVEPAPAPAKAPEPAPVAAQPAPAPSSSYPVLVMPTPADDAALEKAREALRQKMNDLNAGGQSVVAPVAPAPAPVAPAPAPVTPAPAPVTPSPAPVAPAPAVVATPAASPAVVETSAGPTLVLPPSADPAAIEKAREAMRQQVGQLPQAPAVPAVQPGAPVPQTYVAKPSPAAKPAPAPKGMPVFEPLQGPPVTIPAEKQAQLSALLQRYRADEITPDQYHAERAKILAK
jgi:hypothetical protein